MGDPAGIGPEIVAKALQSSVLRDRSCLVVGQAQVLRNTCARLGQTIEFPFAAAFEDLPASTFACLDFDPGEAMIQPGKPSALTGELAYKSVIEAVRLARAGHAGAVVTAPLSKEALNQAGHPFIGHTELLAELTRTAESVMMYAHERLHVAFVTTHLALERVPALITKERVTRVAELTHKALLDLGVKAPRLGVAGLNPHAGEGGLFGRQEIDAIIPAIQELQANGIAVEGPFAGDTIFIDMLAGRFDAIIAMYHDQGGAAFKALAFEVDPQSGRREVRGVNVTLGLPIIRTSVDHGTAFDIAGHGIASPASLIDAIALAARLVEAKRG
ncbi:MAG: 4-hydroxythreonine-4-phosphate dehydrogenase PdxA [Pseudomonadota bacterium]